VMEIKIRELVRRDLLTVANMIKKLVEKTGKQKLLGLISSGVSNSKQENEPNEELWIGLGVDILMMLFEILQDDATAWFADLVGITPDEYNDGPVDIDLQVIEQLKEAPGVADFFTRALRVYKSMNGLGNQ
jgi:hypothetical protein